MLKSQEYYQRWQELELQESSNKELLSTFAFPLMYLNIHFRYNDVHKLAPFMRFTNIIGLEYFAIYGNRY